MKKKLTSILALCVMLCMLILPVAAVQASEGIQPRTEECGNCGRMTLRTVTVNTYETGPTVKKCSHNYPYGDDKVYQKYTTYQSKCSYCSYKSATWTRSSGTRTECYGHR